MYKSNPLQFNNFSTQTSDGTLRHEVGHAFGLDDEYGGGNKNNCISDHYDAVDDRHPGTPTRTNYMMCDGYSAGVVTTIYHYIAVSRYGTTQKECSEDSDCALGEWCDGGVDLNKNQCRVKLADGSNCPLVGGGHACQSGHCRFGTCYTPKSVAMGKSCFTNDQCAAGKCNNAVDGTPGTCVCKQDTDCGPNSVCKLGTLGVGVNQCIAATSPTCPSGWTYENRNPLNKDRCNRTKTLSTALSCKLLGTDIAKNWTGPHAQSGADECRSTKGKKPKGVKCPSGFNYTLRSGADTCTKTETEHETPVCPFGWDYKSQSGRDACEDR